MKNVKKMIVLVCTLVPLLLSLAACSNAGSDSAASAGDKPATSAEGGSTAPAELKTIRVAGIQAHFNESAGVARAQGFIDEELAKVGYKAEFSDFAQAGPAINEAFATNAIDFGIYADFPAITANANGGDVRIIGVANAQQNFGVLVHGDSGIETAKDLEGKKIVTGKGTVTQKIFELWVKNSGADLDKIEQVNAMSDAQAVYLSGEADAIASTQLSMILFDSYDPNGKIIYSTENDPANAAVFTLCGREAYLDENPEAAKAFLRALHRAYQFAGENPDAVYESLATETVPADVLKGTYAYDTTFRYFNPEITEEVRARIQATADFLVAQKLIDGEPDLDTIIDTSFYENIKGELSDEE